MIKRSNKSSRLSRVWWYLVVSTIIWVKSSSDSYFVIIWTLLWSLICSAWLSLGYCDCYCLNRRYLYAELRLGKRYLHIARRPYLRNEGRNQVPHPNPVSTRRPEQVPNCTTQIRNMLWVRAIFCAPFYDVSFGFGFSFVKIFRGFWFLSLSLLQREREFYGTQVFQDREL